MGRKFEDVIDILEYDELRRFKNDLDTGAITLKKLLEEKMKTMHRLLPNLNYRLWTVSERMLNTSRVLRAYTPLLSNLCFTSVL